MNRNSSSHNPSHRTKDFSHLNAARTSSSGAQDGNARIKTSKNRETARKRKNRRVPSWLILVPAVMIFGVLSAMMTANYAQFRKYQAQADLKAAQWSALHNQYQTLTHRLAFLQLPKGREQVLLEHGYLKSNQRILLFPSDKTNSGTANDAKKSANENAATKSSTHSPASAPEEISPTLSDKNDGGSAWNRAGRTVSGWMKGFNAAAN